MQVKTTMSHVLRPVRMAIIKKTRGKKCWWGCGEKGTLWTVGGNLNWCNHYRKQYGGSSKIKNTTTIWYSNSTSGNRTKGNEDIDLKRYLYLCVRSSIICNIQDIQTIWASVSGWRDYEVVLYIQWNIIRP